MGQQRKILALHGIYRMIGRIRNIIRSDSGFSLLEIVVALAIGSIVMVMINSAHRTVLSSVKNVTQVAQFYENVNIAVRRMSRDIECAVFRQDNKSIVFKGDNQISPPKSGTISFVTVNRNELLVSGDLKSEYRETDVKSVQYRIRPDKRYPGLFFLVRAEKNLYDTREEDDTSPLLPQFESLVLENVTDVEYEFSSGDSWNSKWDLPGLPAAVHITIKVKDYKGKDEVFSFTCIPMASRKDLK
jgi:prepilin-type N-terminal cleavage/methylation domain-containing protein